MADTDPVTELRRSLELMWRPPAAPTRGPRPGLTLDGIVAAAVALADAEGLPALSMRNLATALGVGTMSLYRYVPGRGELVALMVDRVSGIDPDAAPLPSGPHWRAGLLAAARGEWTLYRRHPWLLHVAQGRPILGPRAMDATEAVLRVLDGTGLSPREALQVVVLVSSFVAGLARSATEATQAADVTGISNDDWWAVHGEMLTESFTGDRHRRLRAAGEAGAWEEAAGESDLEFGLARLLDGVAARIDAAQVG